MSSLRTIFVAILTLAVAALPAASVSAAMAAPGGSQAAPQSDCAKHAASSQAQHQHERAEIHHARTGAKIGETAGAAEADHAKGDDGMGFCADHPGCGGKCLCLGLVLSAVMPPETASATVPLLVDTTQRAPDSARSPAYIPPSPPPRV